MAKKRHGEKPDHAIIVHICAVAEEPSWAVAL